MSHQASIHYNSPQSGLGYMQARCSCGWWGEVRNLHDPEHAKLASLDCADHLLGAVRSVPAVGPEPQYREGDYVTYEAYSGPPISAKVGTPPFGEDKVHVIIQVPGFEPLSMYIHPDNIIDHRPALRDES